MSKQVWFITGSNRGLGRAIAEEALEAGHEVAVTARNTASLTELSARYGERALPLVLDVTDAEQADRAIKATVGSFGRLDVVVNNAGYANIAPVEQLTLDDFRAQVETVFYGTVQVTKAALPVFREQKSGHFIQIASTGGRLTTPGLSAYHAAKHAVEGFSKVLATEVDRLGIKVTVAEPGPMRTGWAGEAMEAPPVEPSYQTTVGNVISRARGIFGREPIDPAKVARALLDITQLPEPPQHLVLGRNAVDEVADHLKRQLHEDTKWAWIGRSVDFV
ncbi:MAG TPA: SDR family NAD(P)-dependent oxidoreductase [Pseudonocardiaceae bacterium]|nr:SDR family NAD(P)-dependent oxidoreductase [Pseudonocardiaceae bacterium]